MEKERKITAPEGCEIEKVELVDGVAVVTFREKERKLPRSWEDFCEMQTENTIFYYITAFSLIVPCEEDGKYNKTTDRNLLPDRATAEAVLALCQLIQLRNCYNGDWVPDWDDANERKWAISFYENQIFFTDFIKYSYSPLYFKTKKLCDEFLRCFRPLIEKLKPLYGIKEGGEE